MAKRVMENPGLMILGLLALAAIVFVLWPTRVNMRPAVPRNQCIANLKWIMGAKEQWALENHKNTNDIPSWPPLLKYLAPLKVPACPQGGTYTIGRVDQNPTCSIPSHVLLPP